MTAILATTAVAPLHAAPSLRSEMVSQMVLGEGAEILESQHSMYRVRTLLDDYEGWIHSGYTCRLSLSEVKDWLAHAVWSEGALLEDDSGMVTRAPHRARLMTDRLSVILPHGIRAEILSGSVRSMEDVSADALGEPPADWAWRQFAGTPYLWGGVTAAGLDCSGLVQTTFLMRGISLPRDARDQVGSGAPVELHERRAGDLLFFRGEESDSISHVALLAGHETIVHSIISAGRVIRESCIDGPWAGLLRDRLVAVRRLG